MSDVKTRERRNITGIHMIRNKRIDLSFPYNYEYSDFQQVNRCIPLIQSFKKKYIPILFGFKPVELKLCWIFLHINFVIKC